ncbi:DUF3135 domain-containing protein [Zoogloea sp. LCSB751]|uniref:DUF3135 domain-containing protein n=1 Tax=Zoogloea sp. LCSB751 TaxID=1965277 RepID=UPI0009A4AE17|nr:DUF3135 domain-containing protein [Zoogloea sp. LCSB751]
MGGFDFDYWKHLAEHDPVAFFQARDLALRQCIAMHPGHEGPLAALQSRIDTTRVMAGSPVQACRDILDMMEEHLILLSLKLAELQRETDSLRGLLRGGSQS